MQTPGKIGPGTGETVPLELGGRDAAVVEFELREEGGHTLAVTVGYTQGTRERTFRKLYQFQAVHCVLVRTKASVVPVVSEGKGKGVEGMVVLEAQLENVSEGEVVLEGCEVLGELKVETLGVGEEVLMKSRDVAQVAFLVKAEREEVKRAGIGMLQIRWRGMGGEMGVLKTGKLGVGV